MGNESFKGSRSQNKGAEGQRKLKHVFRSRFEAGSISVDGSSLTMARTPFLMTSGSSPVLWSRSSLLGDPTRFATRVEGQRAVGVVGRLFYQAWSRERLGGVPSALSRVLIMDQLQCHHSCPDRHGFTLHLQIRPMVGSCDVRTR